MRIQQNHLSIAAWLLACASIILGIAAPSWRITAGVVTFAAVTFGMILQQISYRNTNISRQHVEKLGGNLKDLDEKLIGSHPNHHTAAGIMGQGDLATMNYDQLIERLCSDGYVTRP